MDSRRMIQIFQEIEEIAGPKIGSYLRNDGLNKVVLVDYIEDNFTVHQIDRIRELLDQYTQANESDFEEMDNGFVSQKTQIRIIMNCMTKLSDDLQYQISNLPRLLELVVQQQLQNVLRCYQTYHKHDIVNMANKFKDKTSNGLEDNSENRLKFTEDYLKDYFSKVVNISIQTGAYKKYKAAVINRFHERYEEMLAG